MQESSPDTESDQVLTRRDYSLQSEITAIAILFFVFLEPQVTIFGQECRAGEEILTEKPRMHHGTEAHPALSSISL